MAIEPVSLARIEWLDIREVWRREASGFTPWLLQNADELGTALGLEIQLETAEHPVGGFSLDLIGRDLTHDAMLIVENQIEGSDHGHLGQLLTYTAGTDAQTIVWIARSFREEHRVAVDWLNQHTGEEIRFFGVVVKAIRIEGSKPAPLFELVAKPNDWQKSVRAATSGQQSAEAALYRDFWEPVRNAIEDRAPELLVGRSQPRSIWLGINSPIQKTWLAAEIGSIELRIKLEIDTGERETNLALLKTLEAHRSSMEQQLGGLDFNPGTVRCTIFQRLPWQGRLIDQPERWNEARQWFLPALLEFRKALDTVAPALSKPAPSSSDTTRPSQD